MNNQAIQHAIEELDQRINQITLHRGELIFARDTLRKIIGDKAESGPCGRPPAESGNGEVARQAERALRPFRPVKKFKAESKGGVDWLGKARLLTEPFKPKQLAEAVGMKPKDASKVIYCWMRKGWLSSSEGWGDYRRTKQFGIEADPTEKGYALLNVIHQEEEAKKKGDVDDL